MGIIYDNGKWYDGLEDRVEKIQSEYTKGPVNSYFESYIAGYKTKIFHMFHASLAKEILFYKKIGFPFNQNVTNNWESYLSFLRNNTKDISNFYYNYILNNNRFKDDSQKKILLDLLSALKDQRFYDGLVFKANRNYYENIRGKGVGGQITVDDFVKSLRLPKEERALVKDFFTTPEKNGGGKEILEKIQNSLSLENNEIIEEFVKKFLEYTEKKDFKRQKEVKNWQTNKDGRKKIKQLLRYGILTTFCEGINSFYNQFDKNKTKFTVIKGNNIDREITLKDILKDPKFSNFSSDELVFGQNTFFQALDQYFIDKGYVTEDDSMTLYLNYGTTLQEKINFSKGDSNNPYITDATGKFIVPSQIIIKKMETVLSNSLNEKIKKKDWNDYLDKGSGIFCEELIRIISDRFINYEQEGDSFNMSPITSSELLERINSKKIKNSEVYSILKKIKPELKQTFKEYASSIMIKSIEGDDVTLNSNNDEVITLKSVIEKLFIGFKDFNVKGNLSEILVTSFLKVYNQNTFLMGKEVNDDNQQMHADIVTQIDGTRIGLQSKIQLRPDDSIFSFYGIDKDINTFGKGIPRYLNQDDLEFIRLSVFFPDINQHFLSNKLNNSIDNFWRFKDLHASEIDKLTENNFFIVNYRLIPTSFILRSILTDITEQEKAINSKNNNEELNLKFNNWHFNKFFYNIQGEKIISNQKEGLKYNGPIVLKDIKEKKEINIVSSLKNDGIYFTFKRIKDALDLLKGVI